MSEELDIRALSVTAAAKLLKVSPKTIREHIRRGLPLVDKLEQMQPQDWLVLELSSFQLETTYSLDCVAATVLNLSDDHLDRHHTLLEYAAIKQRIFRGNGVCVVVDIPIRTLYHYVDFIRPT
jgi:hypothetical protein